MAIQKRFYLPGFAPIRGDKARRYRNEVTGETISLRQFQARAVLKEVEVKRKERLTPHQQRVRWYANYENKRVWKEGGKPWEYVSYAQVEQSPEFNFYEGLIHSYYEGDRDVGYEFFRELEEEYADQDWGETP